MFLLMEIKYLQSDTVFAVKKSLIRKLEKGFDRDENKECYHLEFDIVMEKNKRNRK